MVFFIFCLDWKPRGWTKTATSAKSPSQTSTFFSQVFGKMFSINGAMCILKEMVRRRSDHFGFSVCRVGADALENGEDKVCAASRAGNARLLLRQTGRNDGSRERDRGVRIAPAHSVRRAGRALKIHPEYPLSLVLNHKRLLLRQRDTRTDKDAILPTGL